MNKQLICPPCNVLGTILEVKEGRTSKNVPKDMKTDEDAQTLNLRDYMCQEKKEEEDIPIIEDSPDPSKRGLEDYMKKSVEAQRA